MRYEDDGTGSLAPDVSPYTVQEWETVKTTLLRRRHSLGIHTVYVSDAPNPVRTTDKTTKFLNVVLGYPVTAGIVLMFAALITACILPWVMK